MDEIKDTGSKSTGDDLLFDMSPVMIQPSYGTRIPKGLFKDFFEREKLGRPLPELESSIVEDYIIRKIREGAVSGEDIVLAFFSENMVDRLNQMFDRVRVVAKDSGIESVYTAKEVEHDRIKILNEMRALGVPQEYIDNLEQVGVQLTDDASGFFGSDNEVVISLNQAVRRALDYQLMYGKNIPLDTLVKRLISIRVGHELGHKIDRTLGVISNTLLLETEWMEDEKYTGNRSERFAEYWASIPGTEDPNNNHIREQDLLLDMAKVEDVWEVVNKHNNQTANRIDLMHVFNGIEEGLREKDTSAYAFVLYRKSIYQGMHETGNLLLPYNRGQVKQAIESKFGAKSG